MMLMTMWTGARRGWRATSASSSTSVTDALQVRGTRRWTAICRRVFEGWPSRALPQSDASLRLGRSGDSSTGLGPGPGSS
jgi:hypothetical protein